jgi:apolipoprotein D and lipocalin family protein
MNSHQPLKTVDQVDLQRFMGDWYVIANIPNFVEKNAVNSVENYRLEDDGTIAVTFTYHKEDTSKPRKTMKSRGFVAPETGNAQWKIQFFWPIKFPYYVIDLDQDYKFTVIGLPSRKYLWIMARDPYLDKDIYEGIIQRVREQGFDISKIQRVPQNWDESQSQD